MLLTFSICYLFYLLIHFPDIQKTPWGQGYCLFCSQLYISSARTMSVSSDHSVSIRGVLMQKKNESNLYPSAQAQSIWVNHLTWMDTCPWKLVWSIQFNYNSCDFHKHSVCIPKESAVFSTISFSKYCLLEFSQLPKCLQRCHCWNHYRTPYFLFLFFADFLGICLLPSPMWPSSSSSLSLSYALSLISSQSQWISLWFWFRETKIPN